MSKNRRYYKGDREEQDYKKRSGCKKTIANYQGGATSICITGWNKSKTHGFMTLVAVPRKDGKISYTKLDEERHHFVCTIRVGRFQKYTYTGFFDPVKEKLRIPDIQMIANPSSDYFGTSVMRKNQKK